VRRVILRSDHPADGPGSGRSVEPLDASNPTPRRAGGSTRTREGEEGGQKQSRESRTRKNFAKSGPSGRGEFLVREEPLTSHFARQAKSGSLLASSRPPAHTTAAKNRTRNDFRSQPQQGYLLRAWTAPSVDRDYPCQCCGIGTKARGRFWLAAHRLPNYWIQCSTSQLNHGCCV
jgi:hypothetical protein